MDNNEIAKFEKEMTESADPEELVCKVKRLFKQLPGPLALECFARIMTADLSHPLKAATWRAVRYSHIWWGVDDVLKGDVMNNPLVQRAFGDAVPTRRWIVKNKREGWEPVSVTLGGVEIYRRQHPSLAMEDSASKRLVLLLFLAHCKDADASFLIQSLIQTDDDVAAVREFRDWRGNNILWYLTYREDQNAEGGFACPLIEQELLRLGADPYRLNDLGLCWNDVASHYVRQ